MVPRVIRMLTKAFRVNLKKFHETPSLKTEIPTLCGIRTFGTPFICRILLYRRSINFEFHKTALLLTCTHATTWTRKISESQGLSPFKVWIAQFLDSIMRSM